MNNTLLILIVIASYFSFGFLYTVVLRALNCVFKEDSKFVIFFWPVHLIVKIICLIFEFIDWISIDSTVDFFAKRLPFSKLKE